jgi:hypothetical protein
MLKKALDRVFRKGRFGPEYTSGVYPEAHSKAAIQGEENA